MYGAGRDARRAGSSTVPSAGGPAKSGGFTPSSAGRSSRAHRLAHFEKTDAVTYLRTPGDRTPSCSTTSQHPGLGHHGTEDRARWRSRSAPNDFGSLMMEENVVPPRGDTWRMTSPEMQRPSPMRATCRASAQDYSVMTRRLERGRRAHCRRLESDKPRIEPASRSEQGGRSVRVPSVLRPRQPDQTADLVKGARRKGFRVVIAGAGLWRRCPDRPPRSPISR